MAQSQQWQEIPTHLTLEQFEEFVLPHLYRGSRPPQPKLSLHGIFNYILKLLYLGCQWKELPIEKDILVYAWDYLRLVRFGIGDASDFFSRSLDGGEDEVLLFYFPTDPKSLYFLLKFLDVCLQLQRLRAPAQ